MGDKVKSPEVYTLEDDGLHPEKGFVSTPKDPWDWHIYLYIYHKNQLNIGK